MQRNISETVIQVNTIDKMNKTEIIFLNPSTNDEMGFRNSVYSLEELMNTSRYQPSNELKEILDNRVDVNISSMFDKGFKLVTIGCRVEGDLIPTKVLKKYIDKLNEFAINKQIDRACISYPFIMELAQISPIKRYLMLFYTFHKGPIENFEGWACEEGELPPMSFEGLNDYKHKLRDAKQLKDTPVVEVENRFTDLYYKGFEAIHDKSDEIIGFVLTEKKHELPWIVGAQIDGLPLTTNNIKG